LFVQKSFRKNILGISDVIRTAVQRSLNMSTETKPWTIAREFTGVMEQIVDDENGFEFVLDGKHFYVTETEAQTFRRLKDQQITLIPVFRPEVETALRNMILATGENSLNAPIPEGQTIAEFAVNEDHQYLEGSQESFGKRYFVTLGS
jgi:hypothetical protein